LIELVVVVAIGGLMLALAFNGQSMFANRRLTGMARKLATDARMIEQASRTERTCYRMTFDPVGETYTIERYSGAVSAEPIGGGSQCPDASWTIAAREVQGDTVSRRMPAAVDLVSTTFTGNTLTFSPLGNPNAGMATLRTPSGQIRQVVVEVMGRVRILP
jgi:Tfp pilus assembly protein FimT